MFGKEKKPVREAATEFVEIQSGAIDMKTDAEKRISTIRTQLLLEQTHPWAADERAQQTLAWSSIAYVTDRIAEIVADKTASYNKKGVLELSPVVKNFVTTLSEHSIEVDEYARQMYDGTKDPTITADTADELTLLNHLPVMPEYPLGEEHRTSPPERSVDESGTVTTEFVSALIDAVNELQGYAYTLAGDLDRSALGDIPELYTDLRGIIQGSYLDKAQEWVDYAQNCLLSSTGEISDDSLALAYEAAYEALGYSGQAFTALHCPATFGEDWILER